MSYNLKPPYGGCGGEWVNDTDIFLPFFLLSGHLKGGMDRMGGEQVVHGLRWMVWEVAKTTG